jgi:quinol-cytochrome oxidoreductase complex cytochrome b subunit/coenzyme F420-reducing hydrogenase delta subunit
MSGRALAWLEARASRLFDSANNPFHHLGALTVYCFWIALVTGIYLFVFYDTSLSGAWLSLERISHGQWYFGGVMRSLHRYASDGAVLGMLLHTLRELLRRRYTGPRWFSWLTGVPLVWLVIVFGISGYWMVWDELAQYVAVSTARLLDVLPVFTDPMSRNFLDNASVSERFFTLIAFIHLVGLPIILVIAVWFHLLRIRAPRINPPRALMLGSLAAMLVLSFVAPALSHPPADLDRVPTLLAIDWWYLFVYPLLTATSETVVWLVLTGATLLVAALPWLAPGKKLQPAVVHLPDCNGCGLCAEDCPYGAIDMLPRNDGRDFVLQPVVNADLCVACGICAGACPSTSPLRRVLPLTTGIDLPDYPIERIRRELLQRPSGPAAAGPRLLVVGCDRGIGVRELPQDGSTRLSLACAGMLSPATIDFALRKAGYDGVVISGCDDCHHRQGDLWTIERIEGRRKPVLRERVPRERLMLSWLKASERRHLQTDIDAFRSRLAALPPSAAAESPVIASILSLTENATMAVCRDPSIETTS